LLLINFIGFLYELWGSSISILIGRFIWILDIDITTLFVKLFFIIYLRERWQVYDDIIGFVDTKYFAISCFNNRSNLISFEPDGKKTYEKEYIEKDSEDCIKYICFSFESVVV